MFQLIDDKKNLSEKCEKLVNELKTIDKKYQDKIKSLEDRYSHFVVVDQHYISCSVASLLVYL